MQNTGTVFLKKESHGKRRYLNALYKLPFLALSGIFVFLVTRVYRTVAAEIPPAPRMWPLILRRRLLTQRPPVPGTPGRTAEWSSAGCKLHPNLPGKHRQRRGARQRNLAGKFTYFSMKLALHEWSSSCNTEARNVPLVKSSYPVQNNHIRSFVKVHFICTFIDPYSVTHTH